MMGYRDMTFCPFWKECGVYIHDGCHRAMTPGEVKSADSYGLPMCQFIEKPECFKGK